MKNIYFSVVFVLLFLNGSFGQLISVLTQRYDNHRLGWNDRETILNTSNVNPSQFGLLFTRAVDDQVYAQPLIVSNMLINGGTHNVVFVATVNNSLYAFDADDSSSSAPLWQVNLTHLGSRVIRHTDMTGACGGNYNDFSGNMGIVGTPVIDTSISTLYVVTREIVLSTLEFKQYLHAIDIHTGIEKAGSPVYITATYQGGGVGSVGNSIAFEEQKQNQRPALMLLNDVVYVCWASHCDWGPYHGWMIGFDKTTLLKTHVYNDTPDGTQGGIWMSGSGPTVDDSGYVYITTGNGTVGSGASQNYYRDRGESIIKLIPAGDSMRVVDFFTPSNYLYLNQHDLDYGTDGAMIIPNTTCVLSGTKEGILYMVNTNYMGHYTSGNDSVLQILVANSQSIQNVHIHGTPVYCRYNTSQGDSECVYVWSESDSIRQFIFNRSINRFDNSLTIKGNIVLDNGMPGSMLSISSAGQTAGSGIVWASHPLSGNANQQVRPGRFMAMDARNVQNILWSSTMLPNRDSVGLFAKFNTPVVCNGKVYLATFSNRLNVYGLLNASTGIGVINENLQFATLYPNPAERSITVSYSLSKSLGQFSLSIVDLTGRIIMQLQLPSGSGAHEQTISLPEQLSAGVYGVLFYAEGKMIHAKKMVKY